MPTVTAVKAFTPRYAPNRPPAKLNNAIKPQPKAEFKIIPNRDLRGFANTIASIIITIQAAA